MACDAKRKRLDCEADTVDRISNLPRNVPDLILERLPLHDAARTTVLSKTWRNIWVTHPQLAFDEIFFSQLISKKEEQAQLSQVSRTISNILLLHTGPVLKFHLSIPRDLPLQCLDTDLWIKHISSSGVRKLELFSKPLMTYKMPSYLFSCLELTHLSLSNCILNPPLKFRGFRNLISVELLKVIITADMSFGSQLEALDLKQCTGIKHLGCQFKCNNNIRKLMIIDSGEIDWQWFKCTKKMQILGLALKGMKNYKNFFNPDKQLDIQFLEPKACVWKKLLRTENLNTLHLSRVEFYDPVQIKYVLCLIRFAPNLRILHIRLEPIVKGGNGKGWLIREMLAAIDLKCYSKSLNLVDMVLDQLKTVDIQEVVGSEAELCFIKLLLASSPLLVCMKVTNSTTINDPKEESRILREVIRFPRASPAAQIIWT